MWLTNRIRQSRIRCGFDQQTRVGIDVGLINRQSRIRCGFDQQTE